VIRFDHGYYWEIPAHHHDAVMIAELAQDMASKNLDGIVYFGERQEMAVLFGDGKTYGTSFGAAFQARKVCG
jgi:hypothetical protein